jgi:hypothetical protein
MNIKKVKKIDQNKDQTLDDPWPLLKDTLDLKFDIKTKATELVKIC